MSLARQSNLSAGIFRITTRPLRPPPSTAACQGLIFDLGARAMNEYVRHRPRRRCARQRTPHPGFVLRPVVARRHCGVPPSPPTTGSTRARNWSRWGARRRRWRTLRAFCSRRSRRPMATARTTARRPLSKRVGTLKCVSQSFCVCFSLSGLRLRSNMVRAVSAPSALITL